MNNHSESFLKYIYIEKTQPYIKLIPVLLRESESE